MSSRSSATAGGARIQEHDQNAGTGCQQSTSDTKQLPHEGMSWNAHLQEYVPNCACVVYYIDKCACVTVNQTIIIVVEMSILKYLQ